MLAVWRHIKGPGSNMSGNLFDSLRKHMRTNFVLVDFENVQPKDLGLLKDGPFKVKVFLGPNQSKVPVALATMLQPLGCNAEYKASVRVRSCINTSPTRIPRVQKTLGVGLTMQQ